MAAAGRRLPEAAALVHEIPLDTPHVRLDVLAERGFVVLPDLDPPIPDDEFLSLEYMDWKSGGDTNFAPIATADGELDCQGFWKPGEERPDKGGQLHVNAATLPHARRARSSRSAPTSGGCA